MQHIFCNQQKINGLLFIKTSLEEASNDGQLIKTLLKEAKNEGLFVKTSLEEADNGG